MAEYNKWYKPNTEIKPINGELVLVAVWYDYWKFEMGYYIEETNSVQFFDSDDRSSAYSRISLSDVDTWMMITEPNLDITE